MTTLAYFSNVTQNTARFVEKTGLPTHDIETGPLPDECVLVVPTYGRAAVPVQVVKALRERAERDKVVAVIGTGNINFGDNYCAGARKLADRLGVPLLYTLELAGTSYDVEQVLNALAAFESSRDALVA